MGYVWGAVGIVAFVAVSSLMYYIAARLRPSGGSRPENDSVREKSYDLTTIEAQISQRSNSPFV